MLAGIPEGVAGTRATLKIMARLVKQFKKDPTINLVALEIVRNVQGYDKYGEIRALQHYVRDKIQYRDDVEGVETIRTPLVTLQYAAGDCDDKATLLCALLATIGFSTQFIAVGFDGQEFSHVMAAARLGTRCIPCETILPNVEPGWFPHNANPVLPWNI